MKKKKEALLRGEFYSSRVVCTPKSLLWVDQVSLASLNLFPKNSSPTSSPGMIMIFKSFIDDIYGSTIRFQRKIANLYYQEVDLSLNPTWQRLQRRYQFRLVPSGKFETRNHLNTESINQLYSSTWL